MTEELPMQPGRVPVGELRALVEEWEANEEWHREQSIKKGNGGQAWQTFKECREELREVIDRYE